MSELREVFDGADVLTAPVDADTILVLDKSDTTGTGGGAEGTPKEMALSVLKTYVSASPTLVTPAATVEDAGTNTVLAAATLRRTSSGTPANGIGVAQNWEVETAAGAPGNTEIGGQIACVTSDVTGASEDFFFSLRIMIAGAAVAETARLTDMGWSMPNSSAYATRPQYGFISLPGIGFTASSASDGGGVYFTAGGNLTVRFGQDRVSFSAICPLLWNSSGGAFSTGDTGLNRNSAGILGFGYGTSSYTGTGFAGGWKATTCITAGAAGETDTSVMASELLVLDADTSTDTVANLVPANSIVEWIAYRITVTIGTATAFTVKVAGGNSFVNLGTATTSQTGLTATTTGVLVPALNTDGYSAAAAKLRVDTTGTPSAGTIRLTVKYRQIVPPSS
jgi:hypothetical protein